MEAGMSMENVTTELRRGKGDQRNFVVEADCIATSHMDQEEIHDLVTKLGSLKASLGLDTVDVRVQRLVSHEE